MSNYIGISIFSGSNFRFSMALISLRQITSPTRSLSVWLVSAGKSLYSMARLIESCTIFQQSHSKLFSDNSYTYEFLSLIPTVKYRSVRTHLCTSSSRFVKVMCLELAYDRLIWLG